MTVKASLSGARGPTIPPPAGCIYTNGSLRGRCLLLSPWPRGRSAELLPRWPCRRPCLRSSSRWGLSYASRSLMATRLCAVGHMLRTAPVPHDAHQTAPTLAGSLDARTRWLNAAGTVCFRLCSPGIAHRRCSAGSLTGLGFRRRLHACRGLKALTRSARPGEGSRSITVCTAAFSLRRSASPVLACQLHRRYLRHSGWRMGIQILTDLSAAVIDLHRLVVKPGHAGAAAAPRTSLRRCGTTPHWATRFAYGWHLLRIGAATVPGWSRFWTLVLPRAAVPPPGAIPPWSPLFTALRRARQHSRLRGFRAEARPPPRTLPK